MRTNRELYCRKVKGDYASKERKTIKYVLNLYGWYTYISDLEIQDFKVDVNLHGNASTDFP